VFRISKTKRGKRAPGEKDEQGTGQLKGAEKDKTGPIARKGSLGLRLSSEGRGNCTEESPQKGKGKSRTFRGRIGNGMTHLLAWTPRFG